MPVMRSMAREEIARVREMAKKLYQLLGFALCVIVALVLAGAAVARQAQPMHTYQVHLPIIAQDSPWREPAGFAGNCAGWYENRERHGWYCARVERFYDDERKADRLRIYGAAVVDGVAVAGLRLLATTENDWCYGVTDERGLARCDIKYIAQGPVEVRAFIGNASFRFQR